MISSLTGAFIWIVRGSAHAALAVMAVLIVHMLFRRRLPARWRYALWLAVPAASLLPRLPQTPISVVQYADPVVVRYVFAVDSAIDASPVATPRASIPPRQARRFTWQEIAAGAWILGSFALLAYWGIGHRRTLQRLRMDARIPDDALLGLVEKCRRAVGLRRRPEVIESPAIASPAVTGLVRPLLLLPTGLRERFSHDELRLMVLHELAHVRRGDLITNGFATAMLAIHWFNPVLWFAASRMRADRESACDATVLGLAKTDERAAYGETLLKLQAELCAVTPCPAFVGILENTRRLRDRILRIASFRRGGTPWGICAIALTAGILVCLAADPPAPTPAPAPDKPAQAAPPLSLEYRLRKLAAAGQQIRVQASVREIKPDQMSRISSLIPTGGRHQSELGIFALAGVLNAQQVKELGAQLPPPSNPKENPKPTVTTRTGQRAMIEIIREFRYPVTWEDPDPNLTGAPATPTAFETRNLGIGLEVEPSIGMVPRPLDAAVIDLEISPNIVFFVGWELGKTPRGLPTRSPKFSASKRATTSVSVLDGDTLVIMGDLEIPDESPWGLKNTDYPGTEIKTHRGTLLWLITPRLITAMGEPGMTEGGLAPELFTPRDWQFTNMPIEQCVAHFTGMSRLIDPQKRGLNIVLGKPPTEVRHVSLDLKGTNLINALEFAAKAAGMRVEESAPNTVILTP